MSDFVNTIDLLGDDVVFSKIVDKTITEFKDNVITSVGFYAFANFNNLTSVDLPNVTNIGGSAFFSCKALATVKFPFVTTIGEDSFTSCTNLTIADFSSITSIGNRAFSNCNKLASLILRGATIPTLPDRFVMNYTLIVNGIGYIYVPRALVDTYKSATNWSTYANQFRALEDYTVDGTITGALDETKI